tara:strand:- start:295 stop:591 length:297 start_codon:yes stop_codon:yes gene_type:complete
LKINDDVKNFVAKQLSSTPTHVRIVLTLIGCIFLSLFWFFDFLNVFKRNISSKSKIINNISSLNKYLSSFARVHRSLTVLAFYDHPSIKKIIKTNGNF